MPTTIETSKLAKVVKVDINDPNFDKPLLQLNKDYSKQGTGILIFKV